MPDKQDRFALLAMELGIPVIDDLKSMPECDVALAAHCHRYIPQGLLSRPHNGVLAYHPSLLPRHRGRDAVHWTIAMKDPIAGGTVYRMDEGADTGDIVLQDWCHVLPGDTPQSLWRRELGPMGVRLLIESVKKLKNKGCLHAEKQANGPMTWEPSLTRPKLK